MKFFILLRLIFAAGLTVLSLSAQQGNWVQLPTSSAPSGRAQFGFCYHAAMGGHLLFGGLPTAGAHMNDTWVFDGVSAWTQLTPSTVPAPRSSMGMAYDSGRGCAVMYGGSINVSPNFSDETWEFDGTDWSLVPIASGSGPGIRTAIDLSYDPATGQTILFGGFGSNGSGFMSFADTWGFDGTNWSLLPTIGSPPTLEGYQLVYDSLRGVHVLFGGFDATASQFSTDVWEFDALSLTWTQVLTPNSPTTGWHTSMGFDADRGVMVVHGGLPSLAVGPLNETWEYNGLDWTQTPSSSLAGRDAARFSDDPGDGDLILFGGFTLATDTWVHNASVDFPGTNADCRISVSVNAQAFNMFSSTIPLAPTDQFSLLLSSPAGGLDFARLALVYTPFPQGSPPAGLPLLGAGDPDVWVDPANAVVVLDGLNPTSIFVPSLVPGGLTLGPYNVPFGLTGSALIMQMFVQDPGANPVNISTSDAKVLEFN